MDWSACVVAEGVIANSYDDGDIGCYEFGRGRYAQTLTRGIPHKAVVSQMCMVSKGVLASAYSDGSIVLWDLNIGESIMVLSGRSPVHSVWCVLCMVSPTLLAASGSKDIRVWDVRSGECVSVVNVGSVCSVLCLASETLLACGLENGHVELWEMVITTTTTIPGAEVKCVRSIKCHRRDVLALCMVSDRVIATGAANDSLIKFWDIYTGNLVRNINSSRIDVRCLCMVSASVLASGCYFGSVMLWDVRTGNRICHSKGGVGKVRQLFMIEPGVLASCCETVTRWKLNNGPLCRLWESETGSAGSAYTTALILPGERRCTFSRSAFNVVCAGIRDNIIKSRTHRMNGHLAFPPHVLGEIGTFL